MVYSVSPPLQEQELSFQIQTNTPPIYEVTFDANTYATAPGFYRATSTNRDRPAPSEVQGDLVRFDGVTPDSSGNITVSVSILSRPADNFYNVGANAIQLLLNASNPGNPPAIVEQPQPTVAVSNGVVTLSVEAIGMGITYQWRDNGIALVNAAPYSGVDATTLVISPFTAAQQGQYSVAIFNAAGYVISEVATASISDFRITNDLVAEWQFNEKTGTNAPNSVAGGAPVEIQGTATWAPGVISNGLVFDGTTTWGFVSNFSPIATTAISGAAWVNINPSSYSIGNNVTLFRNEDGDFHETGGLVGQFSLELISDTNATMGLIPTATVGLSTLNGYAQVSAQPQEITTSGWHHLAFTADGAQLRLYVDGSNVAHVDYSGSIAGLPGYPLTQTWISVGARTTTDTNSGPPVDLDVTTGPNFLPGELDDMALWTRALTAAEVQAIYQAGLRGMPLSSVVETNSATSPKLTATQSGGNIVISWTPSGGSLQASAALGSGASWSAVTTNNPAAVPIGDGPSFFRVAR